MGTYLCTILIILDLVILLFVSVVLYCVVSDAFVMNSIQHVAVRNIIQKKKIKRKNNNNENNRINTNSSELIEPEDSKF